MLLLKFELRNDDFLCPPLQLWKRFRGDDKPPPHLGASRDYNIDMNPKVLLFICFYFIIFWYTKSGCI